ncbi:hypothetical protein B9Z55_013287 [Caenorhabditis nigoni]|uniref:Uncharacterized protein n=1 Tax=Caenorhabditis nigoni TaxID=1611254 RepID=A0A2G5U1Y9_9PELO|nr:hypothetical protein B9Z55_013287 [Caenorhabditis nigoni]
MFKIKFLTHIDERDHVSEAFVLRKKRRELRSIECLGVVSSVQMIGELLEIETCRVIVECIDFVEDQKPVDFGEQRVADKRSEHVHCLVFEMAFLKIDFEYER